MFLNVIYLDEALTMERSAEYSRHLVLRNSLPVGGSVWDCALVSAGVAHVQNAHTHNDSLWNAVHCEHWAWRIKKRRRTNKFHKLFFWNWKCRPPYYHQEANGDTKTNKRCCDVLHHDLITQQSMMEEEFKQTSERANKRTAGKSHRRGFHNSLL